MSKETPMMKKKRLKAEKKWAIRQRRGYRSQLWPSGSKGTYVRDQKPLLTTWSNV